MRAAGSPRWRMQSATVSACVLSTTAASSSVSVRAANAATWCGSDGVAQAKPARQAVGDVMQGCFQCHALDEPTRGVIENTACDVPRSRLDAQARAAVAGQVKQNRVSVVCDRCTIGYAGVPLPLRACFRVAPPRARRLGVTLGFAWLHRAESVDAA